MTQPAGVSRRDVLKSGVLAAPLAGLGSFAAVSALATSKDRRPDMNVVLFITDQQRAVQHFPPNWERDNLPGMTRLKRHGLSFECAFTNACMCSPARVTMMTGNFTAQHGVKYTLEENMPAPQYPQVEMPLDMANIATVMSAAGFNVIYKGKWHLSKPAGASWAPSDVGQYGFTRWNPDDAGANQDLAQAGGGLADNDGRFMHDNGDWETGNEGVIPYLNSTAAAQQPFFLIVSLVNPHDVLFYPAAYVTAGYNDSWLEGNIELPATVNEDLSTKPTVQAQFRDLTNAGSPLADETQQRNYLNYYGNLMKASDGYLVELLDTLQSRRLLDKTLVIQTSDHGELGLAHGGMRQKNFNFYEEAIRVPMIYSNPKMFREPMSTQALVSHADLLPTLSGLFPAPRPVRYNWQGVDYSSLVRKPSPAGGVQNYILFTYDDYQSGQANPPYPEPPNHIVGIRESRYKLAEYYDVAGVIPTQYEMYDLLRDPHETNNLANPENRMTWQEKREFVRLQIKLRTVSKLRLRS